MPHPIPEEWIQESTVHYDVMGHSFSVHFRYTPLGEIIHLENHLSDLPQAAIQLILGKNWRNILPKIQAQTAILRFQLPCLLEAQQIPKELQNLQPQLKEIHQQWRQQPSWNEPKFIKDPWVHLFYQVKEANPRPLIEALTQIAFGQRSIWTRMIHPFASENFGQILALPLWTAIPLLGDHLHIRRAYATLAFFPSWEARKGLLLSVHQERFKPFRAEILKALRFYQDGETEELAHEFYQQKDTLHYRELKAVLYLFKDFRNSATEQILQQELIHPHLDVASSAFQILKDWAYSEAQLASLLEEHLEELSDTKLIKIILAHYNRLEDRSLCPSSESILALTIQALPHEQKTSMVKHAAPLMARSFLPSAEPLLISNLERKITPLENGLLDLIGELGIHLQPAYQPSPAMIEAILNCTKDRPTPTRIRAILALKQLQCPMPSPLLFQRLAHLLKSEEEQIYTSTLHTLCSILPKADLDDCLIVPLMELSQRDLRPTYLANVIEALSFFPDISIQKHLFSFHQNHPDENVRIMAFQAVLKWHYGQEQLLGPLWASLLFDSPYADKRFFYLEGFLKTQHPRKAAILLPFSSQQNPQIDRQLRLDASNQRAFESFVQQMAINQRYDRHQDTLNHPMLPVIKQTHNVYWWYRVYTAAPKVLQKELEDILQHERHFKRQLLDFYPDLSLPTWIKGKVKTLPLSRKPK